MPVAGLSDPAPLPPDRLSALERACFITMPFGEQPVGDRQLSFNEFARHGEQGAAVASGRGDLETFHSALAALKTAGIAVDGLDSSLELVARLIENFGARA